MVKAIYSSIQPSQFAFFILQISQKADQMGYWSAENATKAYLKTITMGKNDKEPNAAEFISALSAGNNAQLMVVACASTAGSPTLGLVAAAHQTGGKVVCIVSGEAELHSSINALGCNASRVEFVTGNAQTLLWNQYWNADLVVIDCNLENHEGIFRAVQLSAGKSRSSRIVIGYNAFSKDSLWGDSRTQLLPIGEGLLMTRIAARDEMAGGDNGGCGKRNHWVVKVDKCTGEEHVFRVRSSHVKGLRV